MEVHIGDCDAARWKKLFGTLLQYPHICEAFCACRDVQVPLQKTPAAMVFASKVGVYQIWYRVPESAIPKKQLICGNGAGRGFHGKAGVGREILSMADVAAAEKLVTANIYVSGNVRQWNAEAVARGS